MESCPAEICAAIFSLACTDGGYTGRSLALCSRYINATSKSVRLQSICIRGLRQMKGFAALLDTLTPEYRRVRYLCITDYRRRLITHEYICQYHTLKEQVKQISEMTIEVDSRRKDMEVVRSEVLRHIIGAVASSVVNLSIYFAVCERADCKIPFPLPRLTELTTFCNFEHTGLAVVTLESFKPYPSLRRWNTCGFNVYPPYLFGHIARLAPALTHLRLAKIDDCSESLQRALDTEYIGNEERVVLPLTIEKILIHPSKSWDLPFSHVILVNEKDRVFFECHGDDVTYGQKGTKITEKQWLERINGDRGCWKGIPKKRRSST